MAGERKPVPRIKNKFGLESFTSIFNSKNSNYDFQNKNQVATDALGAVSSIANPFTGLNADTGQNFYFQDPQDGSMPTYTDPYMNDPNSLVGDAKREGNQKLLSSTANLTMTGAKVGGPLGAAIGAGVGLISGFIGKGMRKRKAKKEANRIMKEKKEFVNDFNTSSMSASSDAAFRAKQGKQMNRMQGFNPSLNYY